MNRVSARPIFAVNNTIMIFYGISAVMIGTTLPEMIYGLGLSLARGGLVVSLQNAGGLLAMVAGGLIADRVSKARWIVGSFLALGLILFGVGFVRNYAGLLAVFFTSGVAVRLLDIMLNAHTGDVAAGGRGRAMNLLHMFFSIGAFLGPLVAAGLLSAGLEWRSVYRGVGGTYVLAVLLGMPVLRGYAANRPISAPGDSFPISAGDEPVGTSGATDPRASDAARLDAARATALRPSAARPEVFVLGLVLFLYAIHQTATTAWLPLYLETHSKVGEAAAGAGLSAYWVGIIGSRFAASRLSRVLAPRRILIMGALVGGSATIAGLATAGVGPLVGIVTAGFLTGATIPLAMSVAYGILPSRTGSVTAILSVFMLMGRLIGPWMIGSLADRTGLPSAMFVVGVSLLTAGAAAMLVKNERVD